MGNIGSRKTPLACMINNFKYLERNLKSEHKLVPYELHKACQYYWPILDPTWPKTGSFDPIRLESVKNMLMATNDWSSYPYLLCWQLVVTEKPSWLQAFNHAVNTTMSSQRKKTALSTEEKPLLFERNVQKLSEVPVQFEVSSKIETIEVSNTPPMFDGSHSTEMTCPEELLNVQSCAEIPVNVDVADKSDGSLIMDVIPSEEMLDAHCQKEILFELLCEVPLQQSLLSPVSNEKAENNELVPTLPFVVLEGEKNKPKLLEGDKAAVTIRVEVLAASEMGVNLQTSELPSADALPAFIPYYEECFLEQIQPTTPCYNESQESFWCKICVGKDFIEGTTPEMLFEGPRKDKFHGKPIKILNINVWMFHHWNIDQERAKLKKRLWKEEKDDILHLPELRCIRPIPKPPWVSQHLDNLPLDFQLLTNVHECSAVLKGLLLSSPNA